MRQDRRGGYRTLHVTLPHVSLPTLEKDACFQSRFITPIDPCPTHLPGRFVSPPQTWGGPSGQQQMGL
jgi:hypothetical protein